MVVQKCSLSDATTCIMTNRRSFDRERGVQRERVNFLDVK